MLLSDLEFEYTYKKMKPITSSNYGLFKRLEFLRSRPGAPRFISATLKRRNNNRAGGRAKVPSAGSGYNIQTATLTALGEGMERYCATAVEAQNFVNKSLVELQSTGERTINPKHLNLYADFQYDLPGFQLQKFSPENKLKWMAGIDLHSRELTYVPADMAALGLRQIYEGTSNGLACGSTETMAQLNGTLEVIERDAFIYSWWRKVGAPIVRTPIQGQHPLVEKINQLLKWKKGSIQVLCQKTELDIPVFIATFRGNPSRDEPAFLVSASCKLDPYEAILKALIELFQCYQIVSEVPPLDIKSQSENWMNANINNFSDGTRLYLNPAFAEQTQFLWNGCEIDMEALASPKSNNSIGSFDALLRRLKHNGHEVFGVPLTTCDIDQLGFSVWKMVIPGLLPANAAHRYRGWGHPRLFELQTENGKTKKSMTLNNIGDLNNLPHPFP